MNGKNTTDKNYGNTTCQLTWWQALNLRQAKRGDIIFIGLIVLCAFTTIWSGNMLVSHLTPAGVIAVSDMLDELQIPSRLPNAPLKDESGKTVNLWSILTRPRTVVSIYAPWCPPCQKELPKLVEGLEKSQNLVVIVSAHEKLADVRTQIDNLGLQGTGFYVDITGMMMKEARVKSIPTTFLVGKFGQVKERLVGFSEWRLNMIIRRAQRDEEIGDPFDYDYYE